MKSFLRTGIAFGLLLSPLAAFAATANTIQDVLQNLGSIVRILTPMVVSFALLGFFWGLALYIFGTSDDTKRKKGLGIMIWGIVALFVMFSIFGIVNVLQKGLGIGPGSIQTPKIQQQQ